MRLLPTLAWCTLAACGTLSYYEPPGADGPGTGPGDTGTTPTTPGDDDDDDDDDDTTLPPGSEDCLAPGDEDTDGDADCADADCATICDADEDGSIALALGGDDCDDGDPDRYPAAFDDCDGFDDDCDDIQDNGDADFDQSTACEDCDDGDPDRHPGASETCDGVDSDCDNVDCADFSDGFESGAFAPQYVHGGGAPWTIVSNLPYTGVYSARSGSIGDGQLSVLTLTLDWAVAGEIAFWHRGNTESGYDYLSFYVDGVQQDRWSGGWNWTYASYPVTAGQHELKWQYRKDGSGSSGADRVVIDDLQATGGSLP